MLRGVENFLCFISIDASSYVTCKNFDKFIDLAKALLRRRVLMVRAEIHFRKVYRDYDTPKGRIVRFFAGNPISKVLIKNRVPGFGETYEVWTWDESQKKVASTQKDLSSIDAFHALHIFWKKGSVKAVVFHWLETEEFEAYTAVSNHTILKKAEDVCRDLIKDGRIAPMLPMTKTDFLAIFIQSLRYQGYFSDASSDVVQTGEHFESWIEE